MARLIDIGVKPFLVASSARCLMAQRLVRKVCKKCAAPHTLTEQEIAGLGFTPEQVAAATARKGKGCPECNKTGCKGRFGLFEIFNINDEARKLIYDKVPPTCFATAPAKWACVPSVKTACARSWPVSPRWTRLSGPLYPNTDAIDRNHDWPWICFVCRGGIGPDGSLPPPTERPHRSLETFRTDPCPTRCPTCCS